jgi:predicted membrane-bound spermidine synthase
LKKKIAFYLLNIGIPLIVGLGIYLFCYRTTYITSVFTEVFGFSMPYIYFDNALRFIRRCKEVYDLIIVDSNDPFGLSEGYFTKEFYGICYNALREDGIMVNQQGSPFYKHDAEAMQRSHKRIVNTFPISRVYQAHIFVLCTCYNDCFELSEPSFFKA